MIDDLTTVLVTTSPSKKHPDTDLVEETLASIRWHLPTAQILILCDGVRKEQEEYRARYSDFIIALEEVILDRYPNVRLVVFPEWQHQAWTIAKGINSCVTTPLILFTEHDQRLLPQFIPWTSLAAMILDNQIKLVRFMLEDSIKPEWNHLMLGPFNEVLTKTVQWSQRTHLALTDYYRWLISKHLKPGDRCYLEDRFYGLQDEWEDHKLVIFTPLNPRRIYHSDGRGDDAKFDSVLE